VFYFLKVFFLIYILLLFIWFSYFNNAESSKKQKRIAVIGDIIKKLGMSDVECDKERQNIRHCTELRENRCWLLIKPMNTRLSHIVLCFELLESRLWTLL